MSSNDFMPATRVRQWLAHLSGRQRMSELGVPANQALVHLQSVRHQFLRASYPANVHRKIHDRSIPAGQRPHLTTPEYAGAVPEPVPPTCPLTPHSLNRLTCQMGLFFYDIFWVFGTDVMVSVATKFDAPIKVLATDIRSSPRIAKESMFGLTSSSFCFPQAFVSARVRHGGHGRAVLDARPRRHRSTRSATGRGHVSRLCLSSQSVAHPALRMRLATF